MYQSYFAGKKNKSFKEADTKPMFKGEDFYEKKYSDPDSMRELELFLENDGDLYRQQFQSIIKNIKGKLKSNKYDHKLSPKLWMYYVENGAKKYGKEFGGTWNEMFTKKDRMILAEKLADYYYDQIIAGEF